MLSAITLTSSCTPYSKKNNSVYCGSKFRSLLAIRQRVSTIRFRMFVLMLVRSLSAEPGEDT